MRRKLFSLLAVLLLLPSLLLPGTVMTADAYTTPPNIGRQAVVARLQTLIEKTEGKFFTTTGETCRYPGGDYHGCDKCEISAVISSAPFRNAVDGFVPASLYTITHYYGANSTWKNGKSCCGFANFAGWYLFAQNATDQVLFRPVNQSVAPFTHDSIAEYAQPGDLLRIGKSRSSGTHSAVFIEELSDLSGIKVLDCNWNYGAVGNCQITVHNILYDSAYNYVGVSHAENYVSCTQHSFVNGVCIYCGAQADYVSTYLESCESTPTHVSIRTTAALNLRSIPSSGQGVEIIAEIPKGTEIETIAILKNTGGNYWYKIRWNGTYGYISCKYTEFKEVCKDIELSGAAVPTAQYQGRAFYLTGLLTTGNVLTNIKAAVYKGTGVTYGTPVLSSAQNPVAEKDRNCYDLADSAVDSNLHFAQLDVGAYTYVLTASCSCQHCEDGVTLQTAKRTDVKVKTSNFTVSYVNYPFTDVTAADWYYKAVYQCSKKNLMSGTGDKIFSPDEKCTRAMIVSVLYRLSGSPKVSFEAVFSDVPRGQWYTDAVIWASRTEVVAGYGNGLFGPGESVTREQLTLILKNYAEKCKGLSLDAGGTLSGFADSGAVSTWAAAAVRWAVGAGILSGKSNAGQTLLDPQGTASRAELASILVRFCDKYKF